jgi:hypothetical protein
MFEIKKFDNWNIYKDTVFGSGASEKLWLINNKTNQTGLFKFTKLKTDGNITGEYWAEKLAAEIGKIINVKCAEVEMGTYNRKDRFNELQFCNFRKNFYRSISIYTEFVSVLHKRQTK